MLISHEHRFLFIAQPKTASVAVEAALHPYAHAFPKPEGRGEKAIQVWERNRERPRHLGVKQLFPIYGREILEYFIFATKRDPVDRFISFYFFRRREEISTPASRFFKNYTGDLSLDTYLDAIEEGRMKKPVDQIKRIRVGKRLVANHLCRFEHLAEDLADTCSRIGIPFDGLPVRNISTHRKGFGVDDLTPEQYQRIVAMYRDDIQLLGYADRHAEALAASA